MFTGQKNGECAAARVVYPPGPGGPSRLAKCRVIASARDVPSPSAAVPRARARVG